MNSPGEADLFHPIILKLMKTLCINVLAACLAAGAIACSSCNSEGTNKESKADATLTRTGARIGDALDTAGKKIANAAEHVEDFFRKSSNPDSSFVDDAIATNGQELRWLHAGAAKGSSPNLKRDANKMIADHNRLDKKLKDYAHGKRYPLPASTEQKVNEQISDMDRNNKHGADWDKAWAGRMVDEHQKAVHSFERAQDKVKDSLLKSMVIDALPTLRNHLEMMKSLRDTLK